MNRRQMSKWSQSSWAAKFDMRVGVNAYLLLLLLLLLHMCVWCVE